MADLITLADYKLIEGLTNTTDDLKHEILIESVSKLVRTYCHQEFDAYIASPGKTDIFDIQWDTHVVQLKESPVIEISNVYERTGQETAYTELFRDGTNSKYEWYYDSVSDAIMRTNVNGSYKNWPCGVGSVKIVYTAGYETLPEDLKLAVADLVTYYAKDEYKQNMTIGASSREGAPLTVIKDSGFPDHIRRVLDLYRGV